MKYVVSGYIGFDNFGDEAIAHVLVQHLKSAGAEKITLISSNPAKTSHIYGVSSCGMFGFLPSIFESDILISGGGSLLQDATSVKSLIYYLLVILTGILLRKKVQIYSQGIGPINSQIGVVLTKFILKRVNEITVRDKKSQELLKSWDIPSILVKDPIFDLELPKKHLKGTVGVQLREFIGVDDEFLDKLAKEIAKRFSDKKIYLVSLQDSIDLKICEKFAQMLNDNRVYNVSVMNGLSLNDVFETLSSFEYLVAMRFHANVVGIKSEVKTLAINYDPKVEKLAQEYNLQMINLTDKDFSEQFERLIELT